MREQMLQLNPAVLKEFSVARSSNYSRKAKYCHFNVQNVFK